jgi:hypothetical protein
MDPAEDGLPIPQRYWAILTLMVGVALSCLDTALVNVALPRIAKDLNSSPADSIWVVNAYQLAVMISLLPLASFGDIFGYRRVYRFGLVLYTSAALISALAGSLEMLTLGRALQGLGAAGIMSVNTALIRYTYPRRQLGRGIALTSLVVSTSSAAGPTVAAAILSIAAGRRRRALVSLQASTHRRARRSREAADHCHEQFGRRRMKLSTRRWLDDPAHCALHAALARQQRARGGRLGCRRAWRDAAALLSGCRACTGKPPADRTEVGQVRPLAGPYRHAGGPAFCAESPRLRGLRRTSPAGAVRVPRCGRRRLTLNRLSATPKRRSPTG